MNINRRGFLGVLLGAPAVIILPKASAIWTPERVIELPDPPEIEVVKEAIYDGSIIGVYVIRSPNMTDLILETLTQDSTNYFPPGAPVLAVAGNLDRGIYSFRGNRAALEGGFKLKILSAWTVGQHLYDN